MKQLTLRSIVIIFAIIMGYNAHAQDNAPTKEDAANFIKKILTNYDDRQGGKWTGYLGDITNCTLIYVVPNGDDRNTITIHFDKCRVEQDSSFLRRIKIISLADSAIVCSTINYHKGQVKSKAVYSFDHYEFLLEESEVMTENNYYRRLYKAFDFLIKACGGGVSKDKF